VVLVGVSDGATGCWAAANTIAAPFAGFIAVSGFGGMLRELGMELYPENLMQRPIYNVNAGGDRLYPIAVVNEFLDALEGSGVGVRRKVYPEEEHGFDYRMSEAGTLCALVREWSLPRIDALSWTASAAYPISIGHCITAQREKHARSYSFRGCCRSDTFFLHTAGLIRLRMYFDVNDQCMRKGFFSINNKKGRRYKNRTCNRGMELFLMKQRCFPAIVDGLFFSIQL